MKRRYPRYLQIMVCAEFSEGTDVLDLERKYGIPNGTIYFWLSKYQRRLSPGEKVYQEAEKVISMYKSGDTIESIADHFSVSVTPIKKILRKHKVKIRSWTHQSAINAKRKRESTAKRELAGAYAEKGLYEG